MSPHRDLGEGCAFGRDPGARARAGLRGGRPGAAKGPRTLLVLPGLTWLTCFVPGQIPGSEASSLSVGFTGWLIGGEPHVTVDLRNLGPKLLSPSP